MNTNVTILLNKMEHVFSGPSGIVGERLLKLQEIEKNFLPNLAAKFKGYICLMDSFQDFYIESFECIMNRSADLWDGKSKVQTVIHLASFWRFRASYNMFWSGYFFDAHSLLRAVFENALQLSALALKIITLNEINVKSKIAESKIRNNILGESSGLSKNAISDLEAFYSLLHNSVHKCKLNFAVVLDALHKGEKVSIFPSYSEDAASVYMNTSQYLAWMILRTLPLLQVEKQEFPTSWHYKYKILDEAFREFVADFPKSLGRSIEELISTKFSF